ncbi:MAG: ribonuclease Z [Candidatus Verstraetearchaeota archaeon]|nr:ribonuclease Z [Candidatus Verstraetearchaeota archaeon]
MRQVKVVALGTAGPIPTPERSSPSFALVREGEILLFDCGEGAQRQMFKAGISPCAKMCIFISHLHGDHVFGIFGLLHTMNLLNRQHRLQIYGPQGLRDLVEAVLAHTGLKPRFPLELLEVRGGVVRETESYLVKAAWAEHSVPCLAYAYIEKDYPGGFHPERAEALGVPKGPLWKKLQRGGEVVLEDGRVVKPEEVVEPPIPGIKVVYSGDTKPCNSVVELAREADLLIHEATFAEDLRDRAEEEKHSTAKGAAEVALKAGVKKLVLTHVSNRYRDLQLLEGEAREVFKKSYLARDLDVFLVTREKPK